MPPKAKASPAVPPPPSIWAVPFGKSARGDAVELLGAAEQRRVAEIATLVRAPRDAMLCEEGIPADHVFNLVGGVA
ncbi:MAG: hypothetical protein ACHQZS_13380, partial [Candidatus Binatales bacterium]